MIERGQLLEYAIVYNDYKGIPKEEIRRHAKDICRLPAKGYGTTEFDMADDRLAAADRHAEVTAILNHARAAHRR